MDEQEKNGGPNHLKAWRTYRKITQEQLAEKVGSSQHQIALLESGDRKLTARWLRRLAPALGTTPGTLLDYDPANVGAEIVGLWAEANPLERRQISDIAKAILRTRPEEGEPE